MNSFQISLTALCISALPLTLLSAAPVAAQNQNAPMNQTIIRVDPTRDRGAISPFLYGSNHRYANDGIGTWNPQTKAVRPEFTAAHARAGLKSIRYPGGTVANSFEWKKSIGAVEQRASIQPFSGGGTPTGLFGQPAVASFGLDEAARWCEANGVEMIYMFGIAFGTPGDAADLVEYLNAPVGANPNGGLDWAAVRAQNGHPQPYNVRYFEIANEADGPSQTYWWPNIDTDATRAKAALPLQERRDGYVPEYLFGGMAKFEKQGVGTVDARGGTDFRDAQSQGDGTPNQTKIIRYRPIEINSDQVFVGDQQYTRVPDITKASGAAYQLDVSTGIIRFGDGQRTVVPPSGAMITASYRSPRDGFVAFYNAMKAADPSIKVYVGYESQQIIKTLGDKYAYDGVVIHPYTNQWNIPKAATLEEWNTNLMLSSGRVKHEVEEYQTLIDQTVAPERRGQVRVIVTEFGALGQDNVAPAGTPKGNWAFLNVGLYTASQLMNFMRAGVPQAHRHATTVGVFGASPDFEYSPTAAVYEAFTKHFGDRLIGIETQNVPTRASQTIYRPGIGIHDSLMAADNANAPKDAQPLALPKLDAEASRDAAGNIYVMVLNQDATDAVTATIEVVGIKATTAQLQTLNGASLTDAKATLTPSQAQVENGALRHTFPAHSLTAITLAPTP